MQPAARAGRDLAGDLVQRPVPRRDQRTHADRLPHDQRRPHLLEVELGQHATGRQEVAEAGAGLGPLRHPERRAHLPADDLAELACAALVDLDDPVEQGQPLVARRERVGLEGRPRRRHGDVDVVRAAHGDGLDRLFRRRVDDGQRLAGQRGDPLSVDVELPSVLHHASSTVRRAPSDRQPRPRGLSRTVLGASRRCRPAGQVRRSQGRALGSTAVSASRRSSAARSAGESVSSTAPGSGCLRGPSAGLTGRGGPPAPPAATRTSAAGSELVEQGEAGVRSVAHPECDGAVQLHDGRRRDLEQLVVEVHDSVPARVLAAVCAVAWTSAMAACSTYGPRPRAARSSWPARAISDRRHRRRSCSSIVRSSPAGTAAGVAPGVLQHQEREQPSRLGLGRHQLDELPGEADRRRRQRCVGGRRVPWLKTR